MVTASSNEYTETDSQLISGSTLFLNFQLREDVT